MANKKSQPSEIVVTVDPNTGESQITVVADTARDRDGALDALRRMLPNIELLESSAKPESVFIRLDDGSWFVRYDVGLVAARFYQQATAIELVLASEVVKRLAVKGSKVSGIFRNSTKEDYAIEIGSVWK